VGVLLPLSTASFSRQGKCIVLYEYVGSAEWSAYEDHTVPYLSNLDLSNCVARGKGI
jgi:hypothetical protein